MNYSAAIKMVLMENWKHKNRYDILLGERYKMQNFAQDMIIAMLNLHIKQAIWRKKQTAGKKEKMLTYYMWAVFIFYFSFNEWYRYS